MTNSPIPEDTLWSILVQILSALQTIHGSHLAARTIDCNHILETSRNRFRIGSVGVHDILNPCFSMNPSINPVNMNGNTNNNNNNNNNNNTSIFSSSINPSISTTTTITTTGPTSSHQYDLEQADLMQLGDVMMTLGSCGTSIANIRILEGRYSEQLVNIVKMLLQGQHSAQRLLEECAPQLLRAMNSAFTTSDYYFNSLV